MVVLLNYFRSICTCIWDQKERCTRLLPGPKSKLVFFILKRCMFSFLVTMVPSPGNAVICGGFFVLFFVFLEGERERERERDLI